MSLGTGAGELRDEGFARTVGMLWAWGGVVNVGLSIVQNVAQFAKMEPIAMVVSLIGCPLAIGIFVCWIIFWVQTYQYRKRLTEGQRGYRDGSIEDDYDDRRRPRYDEDDDYDDRDDDRPRAAIETIDWGCRGPTAPDQWKGCCRATGLASCVLLLHFSVTQ